MEIAVGTVIDDRYEVLGRIGAGAVAVVYVARHLQLGSLHAVKVLLVPTRFVQERLLREGRLQGTLRDRNVVNVTDVVDVEGAPGLVMEFVRGPSLERLLQHLQLDPQQAMAVGAGMLLGVRAAHQVGLVHRDIKPANVLIEVVDTALLPKIADFGLAKILHAEAEGGTATREGTTLGTPAYMAPEQIRDARTVDERADVFSLGAVLYEVLTGRRAFPGDDLLDLYDRIREGRYEPVRNLAPQIPPELAAVVDAALKVDRDERISSVAELLDRWTNGRGEAAAEMDWPPTVLALAAGLAPGMTRETSTGMSMPTFDLRPSPPSVMSASVSVETTQPPSPPSMVRRRPRFRVVALLGLLAGPLVCAGSLSVVGAGITAGWLQWGPEVPVDIDRARRQVYGANSWPRASADPDIEELHRSGWASLRQGRPEPALDALGRVVEAEGADDPGLRLLIATALLWTGDARGYERIEQAAASAGTRRTAAADLARLAAQVIQSRGDPKQMRRHFEVWPDDLLGRLLLARLVGFDAELRTELASGAIALDPGSAAGRVLRVEHLLDRGQLPEAEAAIEEAVTRFPGHPRLVAARARALLLAGDAAEARRIAEEVADDVSVPELVAQHAAALRMLRDQHAVDAVDQSTSEVLQPARRVALAKGLAEAAFGLGNVDDANRWLTEGFLLATSTRRYDDAVELARLQQLAAVLLGRPEDLALGLDRSVAASLLGLPPVVQERLTPRILLLRGLAALERDDSGEVQRTIGDLESADGGERQAALLRAASMARQGLPTPLADDPAQGCVGRSLDARWHVESGGGDGEATFAALVAEGSRCARFGVDRYVRADAELHLAEWAIERGDREGAREHLVAFYGWMPDPDLGIPLYGRLAAAEEALVVW